jgi:magnesium-transporting ATPase (P-type)
MDSNPIYSLRPSQVFQVLETSPQGLPTEEVVVRRELYGDNLLNEPPRTSRFGSFFRFLTHPLALILWGAGALAFIARQPALGIVIWVIVLINAVLTFWQEYRTAQAVRALHALLPAFTRVLRAGREAMVPASEIVPGDVLILAEGDNIPADARIVEEYGLRTNNANLTGEAIPARKTADASLREGISEIERTNLVFAGSSVFSGTGRAVVYATGMLTQFGRIARLAQAIPQTPSRLQHELTRTIHIISLLALGVAGIVFVVGIFEIGLAGLEAFVLALGILVAAVPEGLPATVTLSLAMAAQRLAQRGVLVKQLSIMETLGTVSIICTDKSGTLTQNQMTVREVWVSGQRFAVTGAGYEPKGNFLPNPTGTPLESNLNALLIAADLCNNSRLNPPSPDRPYWSCLGDQTEVALRVAAKKWGLDEQELVENLPRLHEVPFDARRKRMSTIHLADRTLESWESEEDAELWSSEQEVVFVKGAPREVLQLCTRLLWDGSEQALDESRRAEILVVNDEYARRALRVLALARRDLPSRSRPYSVENVEQDLTFLGLVAMMDPPRPEVAQAIEVIHQAGIRMVMITGDYGLTAESLARRVGMLSTSNPQILTGAELDELNEVELQTLLEREVIYARMAPEHKLRLVAAFQTRGEVVAVTGDGVNDAPALRKADVAVVMGQAGTDVAKEAADVILTNDNFGNFVTAIEEGRAVYDNLRKFVTYIFSSNVPEILPFILTAMFQIPLALRVIQILAIDLGTDLFPALALGTEKPEPNVMNRPPRRRDQPLIERGLLARAFLWLGMIEAILCYTGFFVVYRLFEVDHLSALPLLGSWLGADTSGGGINVNLLAVTVFHAGVVMAQVGNAFACRTERERGRSLGWLSNPYLILGVTIEIGMILILIYYPPLAEVFQHAPLPPVVWLGLGLYGPILYSLDWLRKVLVRWLESERNLESKGEAAL